MLARHIKNGQLVALKVLKKANIVENDERESILAERSIFAMINAAQGKSSPFLVNCHGIFQSKSHLFFVMEFVGGGDLMFHIQRRRFTEDQARYESSLSTPGYLWSFRFFAAQVLLALEYLHNQEVVYRDLKLDNILVTLEGHIKLADYGLCKAAMGIGSTTRTFCGTPEFMAPEILRSQPYTRLVDWWAFGVLLYELIFSCAPFQGRTEGQIFEKIINGRLVFPSMAASLEAKDLIRQVKETTK